MISNIQSIYQQQSSHVDKVMRPIFVLTFIVFIIVSKSAITQLKDKTFLEKTNQSPYTLVYFYSSGCKFCKEFTPIFEKLSKNEQLIKQNFTFAKIDGPAFQNLTYSFEAYSYPTIAIFFKDVPQPILYKKQREQKPLVQYLLEIIKPTDKAELLKVLPKIPESEIIENKLAVFYGKRDSLQFKIWDAAVKRDGYISWAFSESQETKVVIGSNQIRNFDMKVLEDEILRIYAKVHSVTEQSWLKMSQKKKFTIVYLNKFGNKKTSELLLKLSKELPKVHFIEIDGDHQQYKTAIKHIGVHDEENIVSVDKLYDALYIASSPYTEQSLRQFISKAMDHKLQLYRKTQKTDKLNKLTRTNYQDRMATNQDVIMFLYDRKEQISKELMSLFEHLLVKFKDNKNLLLLRCDVSLNEIEQKLGFVIKPTPKLVFYRNKMKDYPIHFTAKTISVKTVVDFIEQNTTFDFEESWAQL